MLEALDIGRYDLVITCTPDSPRAVDAAELAAVAGELGAVVEIEPDVSTAVDRALQLAGEDDLVLITGSLYVVGAARAHLRPDADLSDSRQAPDEQPLSAYERAKLGLFDDDVDERDRAEAEGDESGERDGSDEPDLFGGEDDPLDRLLDLDALRDPDDPDEL
jgi:hypothetical protein